MFKDIYKRANENIPTDEAYARVMRRVSKKRTQNAYIRPSRVMALAACFLIAFSAVGIYERHEKTSREMIPGSEMRLAGGVNGLSKELLPTPVPDAAELTAKPASKSVNKPASRAVSTDLAEQEELQIAADMPEAVPENTDDLKVEIKLNRREADVMALSGGVRAVSPEVLTEVSIEEYSEYLGVNVPEKVRLPEGFEDMSPKSAQLEADGEGGYSDDRWSFLFSGAEGTIGIETTKQLDLVKAILEDESYEKSSILGTEAVMTEEPSGFRAELVSDSVAYSVTAYGVDLSAVEELLISIVE